MTVITVTVLLVVVAMFSGMLGVLTGIGGGIVLVPFLILLQVDMHAAMAASLVAIMTLSLSTALTKTGQRYTNHRMGIFLETAAVAGAIIGALLTSITPKPYLAMMFGGMLLFAAYCSFRRMKLETKSEENFPVTVVDSIDFASRTQLIQGWGIMGIAGALSGLLGIGSGSLKVLAMDQVLNMPYRVSTSTSNFMVGMTVAASIGIYFAKGYMDPTIIFPVVCGSIVGSLIGSKILAKAKIPTLRIMFIIVILILAFQMIFQGVQGILHS
jgi:uncharacterized membrane protein YfcA